jgi:GntR family transcriptional repressor for pyruvate dehydrogenase complex
MEDSQIVRMSASSLVVEYIKEKLLNGEWEVGAKIATESELMKLVGVGRQAVREAIGNLVSLDILDKRQGSGTYVKGISVNSALNQLLSGVYLNEYDTMAILGFRKIIEPACVRLFIENYNEKSVELISKHLETMKVYEFDTSNNNFCIADGNFHDTIIKGAGNPVVKKVMEIFSSSLYAYQLESFRTIGPQSGVAEHELILKAIMHKDAELASLLMLRHIERSEADILKYREINTSNVK